MLPEVTATRFVTPLREGGSLPALMEADDLGVYVVKFRGAGQGVKVLVAEILCAGIAKALEIPTPDLAVIDVTPPIARYEADEEVQDLLNASIGLNLGIDFLPGAFGFDGSGSIEAAQAAPIVWLDAYTANIDRTWHNPNLLRWHGRLWAIDHGAALYFHHSWPSRPPDPAAFARQPFDLHRHVLWNERLDLTAVHDLATDRLTSEVIHQIVEQVPDDFLQLPPGMTEIGAVRDLYAAHLVQRLRTPASWLGHQ